jgi:biopolymer transport protein ExbB
MTSARKTWWTVRVLLTLAALLVASAADEATPGLLVPPATAQTSAPAQAPAETQPPSSAQPSTPSPAPVPPVADAKTARPSATAAPQSGMAGGTNRLLPQDLTIMAMFLHANAIVRSVMLGLIAASVVTWTILLAKGADIIIAKMALRRSLQEARSEDSLGALNLRLGSRLGPLSTMVAAALDELRRSGNVPHAGIKERVSSRLERMEVAFARRMTRATGPLATIGATAPFIGLFGTVWGIMDSFIGISQSQTTNLAVVAPGIAEALLATAAGLIAAIPAVVIYNGFARSIGGYRAMLADLSAAVEQQVSRELDTADGRSVRAAAE